MRCCEGKLAGVVAQSRSVTAYSRTEKVTVLGLAESCEENADRRPVTPKFGNANAGGYLDHSGGIYTDGGWSRLQKETAKLFECGTPSFPKIQSKTPIFFHIQAVPFTGAESPFTDS